MEIVYYNNKSNQWNLCMYKITVIEHGETRSLYEHNLQWWEDFCNAWSHTTIESVQELKHTQEQINRCEHIKYLPDDFGHVYSRYVETGEIHEDTISIQPSHPFHVIILKHTQVKELEARLLSSSEVYERLDISSIPLEQLKHHKLNQLNEQCNKAIISGFTYEIDNITYLFSSSLEAQLNFTGTNVMFSDGTITEVYWSATNIETGIVERVKLDKVIFDIIKITMFSHVNSQIDRFRKILQPLVLNATTIEEINSVVW